MCITLTDNNITGCLILVDPFKIWIVLSVHIPFQTVTTTQDHRFLYSHIPQDILPDEYGGDAGKIDDLNGLYSKRLTKK